MAANSILASSAIAEATLPNLPNFSLPLAPIIPDKAADGADDPTAPSASAAPAPAASSDKGTTFTDPRARGGTSGASSATGGTASNLTVDHVSVEGNHLVSTEDILGVIKTRDGDKFDRDRVMQDLKAINSMGYFDDRSLQVTPELNQNGRFS